MLKKFKNYCKKIAGPIIILETVNAVINLFIFKTLFSLDRDQFFLKKLKNLCNDMIKISIKNLGKFQGFIS